MQLISRFLVILACLVPQVATAQAIPERLRDCALSVRVALPQIDRVERDPQLRDEAQKRVHAFQAEMSREEFEECLLISTVGFEHGFVPGMYVLGPERWVELSLRGATITSREKRTHFQWGIVREGIHFLPSRHSEIGSGGPETRRHFLELFAWTPESPRRDTWQLMRTVFEVADNELIPSGIDPLLRITAPAPPDTADLDVHSMASIQLNDAGRVEARVGRGDDAQRRVIPSPADRRAEAEESQRRKAAYDKVDWNRVADVRRAPTLTYNDANGCGNIEAFGWSDDRMEAIHLRADAELLRLSTNPQTFDIARQPTALQLVASMYARPVHAFPFCTDVDLTNRAPHEEWQAIAGQITMEVVPITNAIGDSRQRATIRVTGAVFVNAQGVRVTQVQPIVLTAIVGWVSG